MKKFILVLTSLMAAGAAMAKLPALSDEAKAKADESKAKAAWGDKVAAYRLCLSQDKVAGHYLKTKGADMKPMPAPPCADPGPYVSAAAAAPAPAAPPAATPAAPTATAAPTSAPKK